MRTHALPLLLGLTLTACGGGDSASPPAPGTAPASPAASWHADAQRALDRGIAWLRQGQRDGTWGAEEEGEWVPNTGLTAVALAPVVAALPPAERRHDPLVRAAARHLLGLQRADGAVSDDRFKGYENYVTSATLMALAAVDDPAHRAQRDRMRTYLQKQQRLDEGRHRGGFGYNKAGGADLSNAQYTIEALRAAGIPPDHAVMKRAIEHLEKVQNRSENEANRDAVWRIEVDGQEVKVVPGNDGSAAYEPGVSKAGWDRLPDGTFVARGYGSMTYALLKCYILVGLEADDARVKAVIDWLQKNYTWDENPGFRKFVEENPERKDAPFFGLYYYYMTAAKALRLVGLQQLKTPEGERDWRADLARAAVSRQGDDGSWVNDRSRRWEEGNPVLTTAYACLTLQEVLAPR